MLSVTTLLSERDTYRDTINAIITTNNACRQKGKILMRPKHLCEPSIIARLLRAYIHLGDLIR